MDADHFEGTLVLEKLEEAQLLDAFMDAVDSDNFSMAERLMRSARIESKTIGEVLRKMALADEEG